MKKMLERKREMEREERERERERERECMNEKVREERNGEER